MTHPNLNSPTARVSGGLPEQGKTKGSLTAQNIRSQGAGCLINNYTPRQQQEAAE